MVSVFLVDDRVMIPIPVKIIDCNDLQLLQCNTELVDMKRTNMKDLQNLFDFNCIFCEIPEQPNKCDSCFSFEQPHTRVSVLSPQAIHEVEKFGNQMDDETAKP
jgi:hypothetical protein